MKTRIEEIDFIFEPIEDDVCEDCKTNLSVTKIQLKNLFREALTKAHQAGYADGYKQGKFDAEVTAEYGEPEALQDNK